jgi:hypothetical protein
MGPFSCQESCCKSSTGTKWVLSSSGFSQMAAVRWVRIGARSDRVGVAELVLGTATGTPQIGASPPGDPQPPIAVVALDYQGSPLGIKFAEVDLAQPHAPFGVSAKAARRSALLELATACRRRSSPSVSASPCPCGEVGQGRGQDLR